MTKNQELRIAEIIEKTINAQMSPILVKLDNLQGTFDRLYKDLDEDRKGIAEIRTSQATIERLVKELLDMYSNIVRRVGQKAEEKTDQAIDKSAEAVASLVEPVMQKAADKMRSGMPLKKKPWWKIF